MAQKETFILDFRADTSNVQSQFNQLKTAMMDLASRRFDNMGKMSADLRKASEEAMKMGAALKNAVNPTTGKLDLSRLSLQMKSMNITAASVEQSMSKLGDRGRQAFTQIANAVANAQTPMIRTNALLDKMWMTMQNTARWQISSMVLNSFVSGFQNAFTFAKDLNKNLNDIRIVSGDSAAQMERYAKEANKAAKAIGTTTNEMVEATVIYRQQGDNLETAAKKAEITAKMANVSLGVSAQEMSEYLTGIWNSYQVGSDQLELFADKLARVGAVTASNAGELATAMTKVAATANTVGVNYDQLLATISTVSSATRQSEESIGTAFKTIYARMGDLKMNGFIDEDGLTTTLGDVSKQLKQAGFDILDGDNIIKDMGGVIEEIGDQWDGLSRNIQTSLAQAMGGKRQYTQIFALFDNWDKYKQTLQESTTAQGELNAQQKIYLDSWEAASQRTKAIKEDMIMDLVDDDAIIALINTFNLFLEGVDEVIEGVGGFQGVLSLLMYFVVNKFTPQIATAFQNLKANAFAFFGQGEKLARQQTEQMKQALGTSISRVGNNTIEAEQMKSIYAKIEAQQILEQNVHKLTEMEKQVLDFKLKQLDADRQANIEAERAIQNEQMSIIDRIDTKEASGEKLSQEEINTRTAAQKEHFESIKREKVNEQAYQKRIVDTVKEAVKDPREVATERLKGIEEQVTQELEKQKKLRQENANLEKQISLGKGSMPKDEKSAINGKDDSWRRGLSKETRNRLKGKSLTEAKEELITNPTHQDPEALAIVKSIERHRKKQYKNQSRAKAQLPENQEKFDKNIKGIRDSEEALKQANTEAENLKKNLNTITSPQVSGQQKFQGITSGLMGISMAISSINGLAQAFEDGFQWSDITQVVGALAGTLMGLNMVYQAYNGLQIKDSVLSGINAANKVKEIMVTEGLSKAKAQETVQTNLNTTAKIANYLWSNPLVAVIGVALVGAIWASVAALTADTRALKKSNEEYEKHKEKLDEVTQKYEEQKNVLEEKKQKLEEIGNFNSQEAKQLKQNIALQENYTNALERQSKVQKKVVQQQAKISIENQKKTGKSIDKQLEDIKNKNARLGASGDESGVTEFASRIKSEQFLSASVEEITDEINKVLSGDLDISQARWVSYADSVEGLQQAMQISHNTDIGLGKGTAEANLKELQDYLESDEYKKYVEQVESLEDSDPIKKREQENIASLIREYDRASQLVDIYAEAEEIRGDGSDPQKVEEANKLIQEQIKILNSSIEAEDRFYNRKSEIMMEYGATVEEVAKNIDDLQSATNAMNKAVTEYNKNGSISLDTFQSLLSLKPSYLSVLKIENGQMKLNSDQLQSSIELQKENLIMQQLNATISQILTMTETDMGSALAYLTGMTDEHTSALEVSTQELIDNTLAKLENDGATKEQIDGFRAGFEKLKDTYLGLKDISLGLEYSAEDVRKAAKSLKEAEDDLANFYLKKKLDANKREIEKFAKSIENIESAMSFANFADKDSIGAMKEKMSIMREQLAATQVEFDNLANTVPNSDKEAEELFSRMEEYGDSIKDLTLNIKEAEIELDNLKWTVAADAFEEQLEQMSKLSEAMDDLKNSYGVNGSEALRQNALRRMLYSGTSANKNASIYERNKGEYEKYLAMTKDIDKKVNKAHEKALELSYKKEEENLKDKVKEAKSSYEEITRIHEIESEKQKKDMDDLVAHHKHAMDELKQYAKDNPVKINVHTGYAGGTQSVSVGELTEEQKGSFASAYDQAHASTKGNFTKTRQSLVGKQFMSGSDLADILENNSFFMPLSKADMDNDKSSNAFEIRRGKNGVQRVHEGEDSEADEGASIYSIEDGVVLHYEANNQTAGNWMVIRGNSGLVYEFMHMRNGSATRKTNDIVLAGQKIGEVGNTGESNGNHLHLEAYGVYNSHGQLIKEPTWDQVKTNSLTYPKKYVGTKFYLDYLRNKQFSSAYTGNEYPNGVDKVTVGEKGEELVVYGDGSGSVLISEPQILTDLPPGSIVYSAEETKAIKERSKNSATNMINNGTRGLGAIQNAHKAQLRKFGSSLSAEDSYFLTKSFTNDSLWEVRKILSEVENLIDSIGFSLLSKEDQDNIYALHDTIAEKESDLIEEYENAAKNYWEQRFELADNYFEKMDEFMHWDESEDSRITGTLRMYEDILKQGIIEAKDFEAFNQAMTNRLKEAVEGDLDYLDGYAEALTSDLENINEELEKSVARLDSIYNLTEKHFDIVNKLSDAEHEANKNLYMAMNSARWLDESTRELLYNTKDYTKVTAKISEIREDEEELFLQYQEDINNLSEDELWRAEFITAEYEKQVKLKEEELELLSAELDLTKKRQALTNTLMEKNVRVYTGGRWVYMANQKDVEAATQDYLEAQYKYDQQVTKIEQQKVLNEIDAERTALNTQIGENEGEVEKIQKLVEDTRKVWEQHIAKLTYGDLSLQGLGTAVEKTVTNINTAMEKMGYLTGDNVVVDANYQATQKEIDDAVLGIIGMKKIWSETGSLTESQQADLKKYRESLTKASNGEYLTKYYSANNKSYEDIIGDLIANQNDQLWKKAHRLENVDLSTVLGGIFDLENVDVEKVQQNAKEFIGVFSEDEVAQLNENVEISGKEFSNFANTLATSNKVIGDAFMDIVKATNVGQNEIQNWTEEGKAELTELLNRYLEMVRSMMSASSSSSSSSSKSSKSNSSNEGKSASEKAKEASDIIQGALPKKVQNLLNRAGSKLKTQKNAAGTRSSSAGWSMVNERGIEMYANKDGQFIELNPYEKIFNNEQFEFLYDLSKAGASGVSSIMKNYSTKNSNLSIGAMTIELPNVTDTDSFAEGLKGLNDYIRSTKTINH